MVLVQEVGVALVQKVGVALAHRVMAHRVEVALGGDTYIVTIIHRMLSIKASVSHIIYLSHIHVCMHVCNIIF